MLRNALVSVVGLLAAGAAFGQDMPLSQILIDGQGWRETDGKVPAAASGPGAAAFVQAAGKTFVAVAGKQAPLPAEMKKPSCLVAWADGGTLVVGDAGDRYLWAFRVEKDGGLAHGDRYYALRVPRGETASGVTALTLDAAGRLYACTPLGVQVFDPTGRLSGVLLKPAEGELSAVAFGGPDGDTLFVACGGKVFARKTKTKGIATKGANP